MNIIVLFDTDFNATNLFEKKTCKAKKIYVISEYITNNKIMSQFIKDSELPIEIIDNMNTIDTIDKIIIFCITNKNHEEINYH